MDRNQRQALDRWLTTEPPCIGCPDPEDYDEERPYLAHIETYDALGNLTNITNEPIEEWQALTRLDENGSFEMRLLRFIFADGTEMCVSRDGGPWGDGEQYASGRFDDGNDPVFEKI